MINLTLNRVLWLTLVCLVMVTGRTLWVLWFPGGGHMPLASALADDSLWVSLFVGAHSLLFIEFSLFAGSLAYYSRARGGDLVPGWVLWVLALAMIFLAAGAFSAVVVPFVPVYPSWIVCDTLAAISLGVSMADFPLAMRRLSQRRPMTELEATVASLITGQAEAKQQQNALGELRATLNDVSIKLSSAASRTDSWLEELGAIADTLAAVEQREGHIYECFADARNHIANAAQWNGDGHNTE